MTRVRDICLWPGWESRSPFPPQVPSTTMIFFFTKNNAAGHLLYYKQLFLILYHKWIYFLPLFCFGGCQPLPSLSVVYFMNRYLFLLNAARKLFINLCSAHPNHWLYSYTHQNWTHMMIVAIKIKSSTWNNSIETTALQAGPLLWYPASQFLYILCLQATN